MIRSLFLALYLGEGLNSKLLPSRAGRPRDPEGGPRPRVDGGGRSPVLRHGEECRNQVLIWVTALVEEAPGALTLRRTRDTPYV